MPSGILLYRLRSNYCWCWSVVSCFFHFSANRLSKFPLKIHLCWVEHDYIQFSQIRNSFHSLAKKKLNYFFCTSNVPNRIPQIFTLFLWAREPTISGWLCVKGWIWRLVTSRQQNLSRKLQFRCNENSGKILSKKIIIKINVLDDLQNALKAIVTNCRKNCVQITYLHSVII